MRTFILISLVLNVGLALALGIAVLKQRSPVSAKIGAEEAHHEPKAAAAPTTEPATDNKAAVSSTAKPAFNWRNVESPDYKVYIANLRSLHCPESTIADIIIADVNKYYRNKLAPFRKPADNVYKFWQSYNTQNKKDPEFEKLQRETAKEKNNLLKELLGKSYKEESNKLSEWPRESSDPFFQTLSQEKRDRMTEITEKFSEMRNEIYQRTRGMQDDEDRQALKKISQEQTAELAKIFTPDELFEYQLRTSDTVQNARWNELQGFEANEDEFRAIMKAKLLTESPDSGDPTLSKDERARQAMKANDDLMSILGEDRYKEYNLNKNWEYRNLRNIVEKNGGDRKIAQQLYSLKDDVQKAITQVKSDRSLTTEQRNQKLAAIKTEIERTLIESMTERGYKSFKRSASWLRDLPSGTKP